MGGYRPFLVRTFIAYPPFVYTTNFAWFIILQQSVYKQLDLPTYFTLRLVYGLHTQTFLYTSTYIFCVAYLMHIFQQLMCMFYSKRLCILFSVHAKIFCVCILDAHSTTFYVYVLLKTLVYASSVHANIFCVCIFDAQFYNIFCV